MKMNDAKETGRMELINLASALRGESDRADLPCVDESFFLRVNRLDLTLLGLELYSHINHFVTVLSQSYRA